MRTTLVLLIFTILGAIGGLTVGYMIGDVSQTDTYWSEFRRLQDAAKRCEEATGEIPGFDAALFRIQLEGDRESLQLLEDLLRQQCFVPSPPG